MALAGAALLWVAAAEGDVPDDAGQERLELDARQAQERLDLRLRQARDPAPPPSGEAGQRRIQRDTVERLRQQSRHAGERDVLERERARDASPAARRRARHED